MKNKELLKAIVIVLIIIVIVSGTTYAAYSWVSDPDKGYITGTSDCFVLDYTKGEDILDGSLDFSSTYTGGLHATVKVKISDSCNINGIGTLYINIKDDTSDSLLSSNLLRYQVLEGTTEVKDGIISAKGKNEIYDNIEITKDEKEYTVYLWVNIEDVTNDNLAILSSSYLNSSIGLDAEGR